MPEPKAEDEAPPQVDDHAYVAPPGQPWARCAICNLAESAHLRTSTPYSEHMRRIYGSRENA